MWCSIKATLKLGWLSGRRRRIAKMWVWWLALRRYGTVLVGSNYASCKMMYQCHFWEWEICFGICKFFNFRPILSLLEWEPDRRSGSSSSVSWFVSSCWRMKIWLSCGVKVDSKDGQEQPHRQSRQWIGQGASYTWLCGYMIVRKLPYMNCALTIWGDFHIHYAMRCGFVYLKYYSCVSSVGHTKKHDTTRCFAVTPKNYIRRVLH